MSRLEVGTERSLAQILRRMILPALFVGALFLVLWLRKPPDIEGPESISFSGEALGTTYSVTLVAERSQAPEERRRLEETVASTLAEVDRSMSTWRDDSELSRFNDHGTEPFAASPMLLKVVDGALEVGERSRGAFDVSVGPLVDAWGFGSASAAERPSGAQIAELLESSGMRHLDIDLEGGTLTKALPDLRLDLSAIAKGFAVDRIAAALDSEGYPRFMVEVGGEVIARGRNAADEAWRIGIEVPDPTRRAVFAVVGLDNLALATSGNYRNFRLEDGQIVSHIIDPRTGRPVEHSLASVSVIARDCMTADAWATALSVLGPEEGLSVARAEGLAAYFITRTGDGFEELATAEFERHRAIDS